MLAGGTQTCPPATPVQLEMMQTVCLTQLQASDVLLVEPKEAGFTDGVQAQYLCGPRAAYQGCLWRQRVRARKGRWVSRPGQCLQPSRGCALSERAGQTDHWQWPAWQMDPGQASEGRAPAASALPPSSVHLQNQHVLHRLPRKPKCVAYMPANDVTSRLAAKATPLCSPQIL